MSVQALIHGLRIIWASAFAGTTINGCFGMFWMNILSAVL